MAKIRRRAIQIFIGEGIITMLTIMGTLAFLESGIPHIIRNVIITDILFLIAFFIWVKLFSNYEQMYKQGLKEE
jgi:hypothetical protein